MRPAAALAALAVIGAAWTGTAAAAVSLGVERGVAEGTDRNRDMRQLGLTLAVGLFSPRVEAAVMAAVRQLAGNASQ